MEYTNRNIEKNLEFYGRATEVRDILNCIMTPTRDKKFIYVHGPNNIGKSTLLQYIHDQKEVLQEQMGKEQKLAVAYASHVKNGKEAMIEAMISLDAFCDKETLKIAEELKKAEAEKRAPEDKIKNSPVKDIIASQNNAKIKIDKELEKIKPSNSNLASVIGELYKNALVNVTHAVLIVDEFRSIEGMDEKDDIITFLTALKGLNNINVTLILASRLSFSATFKEKYDEDFCKWFNYMGISGYSDGELEEVYRNLFGPLFADTKAVSEKTKRDMMKEVYFICGRHPGLLKEMQRYLASKEKKNVETVKKAVNDYDDLKKIFEDFYKLLQTVDNKEKLVKVFDKGFYAEEKKNNVIKELYNKGFIIKTVGISATVEGNADKGLQALLGDISDYEKSRLEIKCIRSDDEDNESNEYEPISPYMYEYAKKKYREELAEKARRKEEAFKNMEQELKNTKDELERKEKELERMKELEVELKDKEEELEKLRGQGNQLIVLENNTGLLKNRIQDLTDLSEKNYKLGLKTGELTGVKAGLDMIKDFFAEQSKTDIAKTQLYTDLQLKMQQMIAEKEKLAAEERLKMAKTAAEERIEMAKIAANERLRMAELSNSGIAEAVKLAFRKEHPETLKKIEDLSNEITKLREQYAQEKNIDPESEKVKELETALIETQNSLSALNKEYEQYKKDNEIGIIEARNKSLQEKYEKIVKAEEITEELLKNILSATWYCDTPNFSDLSKAIQGIKSVELENELKVALYLHDLINDTNTFLAWDYTVVTMLYAKLYETLLKKYHFKFYKEIVGGASYCSDRTKIWADVSENRVTIGSFTNLMEAPERGNPHEHNYFQDLKDFISSVQHVQSDIMDNAVWENHLENHKRISNVILDIRNNVMHPGELDQSRWYQYKIDEFTDAENAAKTDSAQASEDVARDMLKILLYEMFSIDRKGVEEVAVIGNMYLAYKEPDLLADKDSLDFVFKERKFRANQNRYAWSGIIMVDGEEKYKASISATRARQDYEPIEGEKFKVKAINFIRNQTTPYFEVYELTDTAS